MAYEQVSTVKVARPDTPEGYMIVNASEYRAGLPPWMYEQGLAWDPAVYAPYVEPVLKAPTPEASPEPTARMASHGARTSPTEPAPAEKK